jgi:hypothetical protein
VNPYAAKPVTHSSSAATDRLDVDERQKIKLAGCRYPASPKDDRKSMLSSR